ncbi:DUF397 domain-containing protein [Streptomyces sp. NPDC050400]|uniref:DUF397 domain-containing protein n=1 Tax=Streptomyces sp. NPDC050400 TaxID=3365610 RepID=UPI0037B4B953
MTTVPWQKSSFSGGGEGNDCVELAPAPGNGIRLRESDTPTVELATTHTPLAHLIHTLKGHPATGTAPSPRLDVTFAPDGDLVHLRETSAPDTVVTTTRRKWDAFVLGVRAGEFDHFVRPA